MVVGVRLGICGPMPAVGALRACSGMRSTAVVDAAAAATASVDCGGVVFATAAVGGSVTDDDAASVPTPRAAKYTKKPPLFSSQYASALPFAQSLKLFDNVNMSVTVVFAKGWIRLRYTAAVG